MRKPVVYILGVITGVAVALVIMLAAGLVGMMQSFTASSMRGSIGADADIELYPGMLADSVRVAVGAPSHVVHTWALWKSCDVWMYTEPERPAISIIMIDGRLYSVYQRQTSCDRDADCTDPGLDLVTDTVEVALELPLQQ